MNIKVVVRRAGILMAGLWMAGWLLSELGVAENRAVASENAASSLQKAEALKEMGLFQGSDRGFELERPPTRAEALVMLVRLLGKEQEAVAQYASVSADKPSHPFVDVPNWAQPYVSYAWRNKLVAGVSATRLGADDPVSAPQYYTFVLRALGYDDRQGDFQWEKADEQAAAAGLFVDRAHADDAAAADAPFVRADLMDISYAALGTRLKNEDETLLLKLMREGAVDSQAAVRAGIIGSEDAQEDAQMEKTGDEAPQARETNALDELGREHVVIPVAMTLDNATQGWIEVDREELTRRLPQWKKIMTASLIAYDTEWSDEERERVAMLALLKEKLSASPIVNTDFHQYIDLGNKASAMILPDDIAPVKQFRAYAVMDDQDRVIAYTTLDDLDMDKLEWRMYVYPDEDTYGLKSGRLLEEARKLADGALYLTHAYANPNEAAPQAAVPVETTGWESRTILRDGSEKTEWITAYVIKEASLPLVARSATHQSGVGIWVFAGAHSPEMYAQMPVISRISYLLYNTGKVSSTGLRYGEIMPWQVDLTFPTMEAEPTKRGVAFTFLEDDKGQLLAYTSFYYPLKPQPAE